MNENNTKKIETDMHDIRAELSGKRDINAGHKTGRLPYLKNMAIRVSKSLENLILSSEINVSGQVTQTFPEPAEEKKTIQSPPDNITIVNTASSTVSKLRKTFEQLAKLSSDLDNLNKK